jgi:molecular chaperone GrpE
MVRVPVNQPAPRHPLPDDQEPTPEQSQTAPAAQPDPTPLAQPQSPAGENEAQIWQERYARLQADLENTKKRLEKRYASEAEQARYALLRDMLPVADNLESALQHSSNDAGDLRQGVAVTLRAFLETMKRHGVEPISAKGRPFDPALHEAVAQIEDANTPSGHVAQVLQTGYTIDGDLLRPAQVIVAA